MSRAPEYHVPVLGREAAVQVVSDPQGIYVDATLGGGGHAELLLEQMEEAGRLIGIDRDPEAIREASRRLERFKHRVVVVQAPFWELPQVLMDQSVPQISGALFDLGVSSHQIDEPARGFSFQQDGPLDMRMGPDAQVSAGEVLRTYSLERLTQVFREYGEERAAGRIARAICRRRAEKPLERTLELAELVGDIVRGPHGRKALARIFQALRIEVNGELRHLQETLEAVVDVLLPGGRIGVLSYHSLEDRTVKQVFRAGAKGCVCPPDLPVCGCGQAPRLKIVTSKGIRADEAEREQNPRARSATLRIAERLEDAPRPTSFNG